MGIGWNRFILCTRQALLGIGLQSALVIVLVRLLGGWSRNHRCVFSLYSPGDLKIISFLLRCASLSVIIPNHRTNDLMFCTEPYKQFSSTASYHFAFSCIGIWPGLRCFIMCFHVFIPMLLKLQEWGEAFVMKLLPFALKIIVRLENEWPIYRPWWSLTQCT